MPIHHLLPSTNRETQHSKGTLAQSTAPEHRPTMASSGSSYIPWNKMRATVPEGIQVPMCFCGSLCKLMESKVLGDDYDRRFFMCENYEYDPPKQYGKQRAKVIPSTS